MKMVCGINGRREEKNCAWYGCVWWSSTIFLIFSIQALAQFFSSDGIFARHRNCTYIHPSISCNVHDISCFPISFYLLLFLVWFESALYSPFSEHIARASNSCSIFIICAPVPLRISWKVENNIIIIFRHFLSGFCLFDSSTNRYIHFRLNHFSFQPISLVDDHSRVGGKMTHVTKRTIATGDRQKSVVSRSPCQLQIGLCANKPICSGWLCYKLSFFYWCLAWIILVLSHASISPYLYVWIVNVNDNYRNSITIRISAVDGVLLNQCNFE